MRRKVWILFAVALSFLGLNHSWAHAALVSVVASPDCPQAVVDGAKQRVADFFGEVTSSPILVCLTEPTLGLDVSHGTAHFAPGLPSIVVLGPNGTNLDVAAHEIAHAELKARTSALLRTYRIPTWFDEGLAMQLDRRADYAAASWERHREIGALTSPSLDLIETPAEFFRPGEIGKAHYAFSRCVVGHWLANSEPDRLMSLIGGIGWFTDFPSEEFKPSEAACLETPHAD